MPTRSGGSATVGRVRRRSARFGEIRPADNSVPLREEFERRRIAFLERVARARTRQTNKLIAIYTAPVPAAAMQIPQPGRGSPPPLTRLDYENKDYPGNSTRNRGTVSEYIYTFVALGIYTGLFIYTPVRVFEGFEEF